RNGEPLRRSSIPDPVRCFLERRSHQVGMDADWFGFTAAPQASGQPYNKMGNPQKQSVFLHEKSALPDKRERPIKSEEKLQSYLHLSGRESTANCSERCRIEDRAGQEEVGMVQ